MSNSIRLKVTTKDKLGMALEILRELFKLKVDLKGMEVITNKISVKITDMGQKDIEILKNTLLALSDVIEVSEIPLLFCEEKERKLLNIIDSAEDRIIAMNKRLQVEMFDGIIGKGATIQKVKALVDMVAKANSTVMLNGESGTGKEVFAKAIQQLSNRRNKTFITINCAAIPVNLIESELFGYEKGSFTGAIGTGKDGLFKKANGGTLFLDEIGEVSMPMQAKLLRVLQENKIRKIGGSTEEEIDVRIIVATNRNLREMIKEGTFREDLYYRLNIIPIKIPPLRDRLEDVPDLIHFFLDKLNEKLAKKIIAADIGFIEKCMSYNWPGNIRELQNVIERAMTFCDSDYLHVEHLLIDHHKSSEKAPEFIEIKKTLKLSEIVAISEKTAVEDAIKLNSSCRKAAKQLGVSHTTVINKIKKYNINYPTH